MGVLLSCRNLCKQYRGHPVLQGLSFDIHEHEFFTLLGPSGCGKTTLLRILSGHDRADHGQLLLGQHNILNTPAEQRPIHTVFQDYALFPHLDVSQNIAFGLRCQGLSRTSIEQRVLDALARVHLTKMATKMPHQLSGGQQQRVAIARALVMEPKILLLDEPMSALDRQLRQSMRIQLKNLQNDLGISFIMVTHDQEEALTMSDRVAVMQDGQLIQVDTPRQVYEKPQSHRVAQFIGDANFFKASINTADAQNLTVTIADTLITLPNKKGFSKGQTVEVMVRPEDLSVWDKSETKHPEQLIPGRIHQVTYKGSTVDLVIQLTSGQLVHATEFFDEEDDQLIYQINEPVWIEWVRGWEVIFDA